MRFFYFYRVQELRGGAKCEGTHFRHNSRVKLHPCTPFLHHWFILHFGGFCGIEETYSDKYWQFRNFDTPWGQCLTNLVYFVTYSATGDKFGTIGDIVENAKALYPFILHFDGFWGIVEAYFKKYWGFSNFDIHWDKCFMNLGHFKTYLTTGDKLVTIGYLGCMSKMFISIHTSLWWILRHWMTIFKTILTIY